METTNSQLTAEQVHETIYDGVDLPVHFKDPTRKPELVKVRKLSRKQGYPQLALAWEDEEREVSIYLDKPLEFVRELDDESFDKAWQEGRRLNFSSFSVWFRMRFQSLDLMKQQNAMSAEVIKLVENSPTLRKLLGSMNSSAPRGTGTPTSGATR